MQAQAMIRDIAESVGADIELVARPAHAEGRRRYPRVVVTFQGKTFITHRPTWAQCRADVERWLKQVGA